MKLDAIDALGRVGGSDAIQWLESIALTGEESEPIEGEPPPDVALRRAAYKALKRAKRADARRSIA